METAPGGTASEHSTTFGGERPRALPVVLAAALGITGVLLVIFRYEPREPPSQADGAVAMPREWTPALDARAKTVALEVDYGNGARREFAALPWKEGMTVGGLMRAAGSFAPRLVFTQEGRGKMAFLTSIDRVANRKTEGRFWLYEVNGAASTVSFDVQPLKPGDRVLWQFKQTE